MQSFLCMLPILPLDKVCWQSSGFTLHVFLFCHQKKPAVIFFTYVALVDNRNGLLTNWFSCVATELWPLGKSCCCRLHRCFEVVFRSDHWQELLLKSAYITYVCLHMNTLIHVQHCNSIYFKPSNHLMLVSQLTTYLCILVCIVVITC